MAKKEKNAEKTQQVNKTPELAAAKKAFQNYLKENNLDPTKDYSKDKVHGKNFRKLLEKLNKERDKVAAKFPETDKSTMDRIKNKAKKQADKEAKVDHVQKKLKAEAAEKKENKSREPRATKYEYPLIDGREMNASEKKKFRAEQRKLKETANHKDNESSAQPEKGKKKLKRGEEKALKAAEKKAKKVKAKAKNKKEED